MYLLHQLISSLSSLISRLRELSYGLLKTSFTK